MKTIVLLHHEQLLEIKNDTGVVVVMMEVVLEASIEILLVQNKSKWAKNMK
jgi:hypothetical protein